MSWKNFIVAAIGSGIITFISLMLTKYIFGSPSTVPEQIPPIFVSIVSGVLMYLFIYSYARSSFSDKTLRRY